MSLIASALKHMLAAGMPHEAIIAAVEEMEATLKPAKSARSERNARYYENHREELRLKASERRLNTTEASETSEQDDRVSSPVPKETSPLHPPKEITLIPTIPTDVERVAPKRGTRLSADWQPSPADIEFAQTEGTSPDAIQREAAKFRDFWAAKAGAGGVKLDWGATWRNWIRNNASNGKSHGQRNQQPGLFGANRGGPREDPLITAARREIDGMRGSGWG